MIQFSEKLRCMDDEERTVYAASTLDDFGRELWYLKQDGYTQDELATMFGVSQKTISKRLQKINSKVDAVIETEELGEVRSEITTEANGDVISAQNLPLKMSMKRHKFLGNFPSPNKKLDRV